MVLLVPKGNIMSNILYRPLLEICECCVNCGGSRAVSHFSSPGLGQASILSPYYDVAFVHPWGEVVRAEASILYTCL
jgi:hypothetical protein